MAIYKVSLGIGIANARHEDEIEIPDDELEACKTEEEKEELINQYWCDWSSNYIDGGIWQEEE